MNIIVRALLRVLLSLGQAVKPPELNPETEESLPSRRSPEGPAPPVLTEVTPTPPSDSPPDLESVEKKMDQGRYKSVVSMCFLLSCISSPHYITCKAISALQQQL